MAASLRGQLGVRSSALSPTSSKLTTQMLVINHMDNHYKKISKAKPAVDNTQPKSMTSSQKLRDRQIRNHIQKYGSRPSSRTTCRSPSANGIYNEELRDTGNYDDHDDDEEYQVRSVMRTALRLPLTSHPGVDGVHSVSRSKSEYTDFGGVTVRSGPATVRTTQRSSPYNSHMGQSRPSSARSCSSIASNCSRMSGRRNPLKVTYEGDVLDKHSHSFTEPSKPFTPRTLKSNRESSLKQYKYYTPPKAKMQVTTYKDQGPVVSREHEGKGPSQVKSHLRKPPAKVEIDLGATETLTETMLMDMSLQSRDPRQRGVGGGVPRLDISVDKDHFNWMQDQATRAQLRAVGDHSQQVSEERGSVDCGDQTATQQQMDSLRFTRTMASTRSSGPKTPTSYRLTQAEQEQKYVAFAHEVTQDIVSRSISSDRVLQRVFDSHIAKKKVELDERRLRAIIADIRRDLGVQAVDPVDTTLEGTKKWKTDSMMDKTDFSDTFMSAADKTDTRAHHTEVVIDERPDTGVKVIDECSDTAIAAIRGDKSDVGVNEDVEEQCSLTSDGVDRTLAADSGTTAPSTLSASDVDPESAEGSQQACETETIKVLPPTALPRSINRQGRGVVDPDVCRGQDTDELLVSRGEDKEDEVSRGEDKEEQTDTDVGKEEDEEEEEYEDDYDADEDDAEEANSSDDF